MSEPTPLVREIMDVLHIHRWKTMGVSTVRCECGEVVAGSSELTEFPADEAFRRHVAEQIALQLAG